MSETKRSASSLVCPECGGEFAASDLLDGDSVVTCLNCGKKFSTSEILRKSSEVEAEEIRSKAYRDVESERTQAYREAQAERTRAYKDIENERTRAFWENESEKRRFAEKQIRYSQKREIQNDLDIEAKQFRKSKKAKWLIAFSLISMVLAIVAFTNQSYLSGFWAIILTLLTTASWLIGINAISIEVKGVRRAIIALTFFLCIPLIYLYANSFKDVSTTKVFNWETIVLNDCLPQPETNNGSIIENSDQKLTIELYNTNETEFAKYKKACVEFGYTERSKTETNSYFAVNNNGYKLDLNYRSYSNEISIELTKPEPSEVLIWTDLFLSSILPKPTLLQGRVIVNSNEELHIYVIVIRLSKMHLTICDDCQFNDVIKCCRNIHSCNTQIQLCSGNESCQFRIKSTR